MKGALVGVAEERMAGSGAESMPRGFRAGGSTGYEVVVVAQLVLAGYGGPRWVLANHVMAITTMAITMTAVFRPRKPSK